MGCALGVEYEAHQGVDGLGFFFGVDAVAAEQHALDVVFFELALHERAFFADAHKDGDLPCADGGFALGVGG